MKLNEYFDKQKNMSVPIGDKLEIYQNIISQRRQKSLYQKRYFFSVKAISYGLTIFVLMLGLYGTYIFKGNIIINNEGFFIQKNNGLKEVEANYIAKVVDFNGVFYIEHNGKYYQTSYIQDGDIVVLQKNTELLFHIDESTEAKIIGPAKLTISKNNSDYKINLINGDFIELKSLKEDDIQKVELETKNLKITQTDNKSQINFQYSKDGDHNILKNNGGQLLITQNTEENKKITKTLDSEKALAIKTNDISVIDEEKIGPALTKNDISQTFDIRDIKKIIDDNQSSTIEEINEFIPGNNINNTIDSYEKEYGTGIAQNAGFLNNEKQTPTENQYNKLSSNLNKSSLIYELENMTKHYIQGNDLFYSSINNIENKIKQAAISMNIELAKSSGSNPKENIISLKENITSLYEKLNNKYYIPPKYTDNLKETISWLNTLNNYSYGDSEEKESIEKILLEIKLKYNFK